MEGKIPPQAQDLEEAVLGAMLIERRGAYLGGQILKKEHFYKPAHQDIFEAINNLQKNGEPVDLVTVVDKLRKSQKLDGVGGALYISKLTDRVASTANLEYHCKIIVQKYMSRESIRISADTTRRAFTDDHDIFELIDETIEGLHSLTKNLIGATAKDLDTISKELKEQVEANQKGVIPGLPTGVEKYDQNTGGQQKGHLIIYAGRPGQGKTARMCNEIFYQLKLGKKIIIHSLEMPAREIMARIIALEANIYPSTILKRKLSESDMERFLKALEWARTTGLHILENTSLTSIILESSMIKNMKGLDAIYVDYLQIATAGQKEKYKDVSTVSTSFKQMAKDLDVPVIALAQLSRSVEQRVDKKPQLSDLKESGQIEQDADIVEFLWRPEYYGMTIDDDGNDITGQCHYINGKMRGGTPNQTIVMKWEGAMNRLTTFEEQQFKPEPDFGFDGEAPF